MSQIKILIADPYEFYLEGIVLEFLRREKDHVDLHGITDVDFWEEFCKSSEEYDIALINEKMAGGEISESRFRHIFILTESMDGGGLRPCLRRKISNGSSSGLLLPKYMIRS